MKKALCHRNAHFSLPVMLMVIATAGILLSGCQGQGPKVYRVGVLHYPGNFIIIRDGFKAKMAELGYTEGTNIIYESKEVPQTATPAETLSLAREFVDSKVDLILAFPTPSVLAAFEATKGTNIPVVFAMANTEGAPFIKTVQQPGGNLTGVRNPGSEVLVKRLELLLEIAPHIKRVWVGFEKKHPNTPSTLQALRPAAASLGVELVEVAGTSLDDLRKDLTARAKSSAPRIDAIITVSDGFNQGPDGFALLSAFAKEQKIPLCGSVLATVEAGAVFGNSPEMFTVGRLAAPLADKIFKGEPAGTIPVITPEQEIYINAKEARRIGLNIPETLLKQAKEIIR